MQAYKVAGTDAGVVREREVTSGVPILVRGVVLRNEECLGLLSDHSALLLAEKGASFYYFSEGLEPNEKEKELNAILNEKAVYYEFQLTAFVQNKGKELIKLKLNQLLLFYNAHVEEPYLFLPALVPEYYNGRLFESAVHMTTVQWGYNADLATYNEDGSITVKSITYPDYVYINVSPNGVLFKITFPGLVFSRETDKYQYVKQDQLYSLHYYPSKWKNVVEIARYYHSHRYKETPPQIPLDQIVTMTLPKTKNPYRTATKSKPLGVNVSTLSCVFKSMAAHPMEQSCVSFLSCCLEKNNTIVIEYNQYMTLKYMKRVVEVILNEFECCFLTDVFSYLKFWSFDPTYQRPLTKVFNVNILPMELFDFEESNTGVSISRAIPCKSLFEMMKSFFEKSQKTEIIENDKKELNPNYSSVVYKEASYKDVGELKMFSDKRIRAKFEDRTIIDVEPRVDGSLFFSLLTSTADVAQFIVDGTSPIPFAFAKYASIILYFRAESLKTTEEKRRELEVEKRLNRLLDDCYHSNKVMLAVNEFAKKINSD